MASDFNVQVKKQKKYSKEELESLSKEELVQRLVSSDAQIVQLKALLSRALTNNNDNKKNKSDNVGNIDIKINNDKKKKFDFAKCHFRHILLKFFYVGWDFQGYAVQEDNLNTIEHYLFEALTKTCLIEDRTKSNYHRCGRTDKGVSAFGQVISLDIRSKLLPENQEQDLDKEIDYCKILNKVLPNTIQCVAWAPAKNEEFSARFDCNSRKYKYFFPKGKLNIEKMKEGCKKLIGTHDFRNLCKMDVGNGVVAFTRSIFSFDIEAVSSGDLTKPGHDDEYSMYVATIKSKSFLWHQIRCIMAVLMLIGEGKETPDVVDELLDVEKNPRKPEYNLASEVPLNLYECDYGEDLNWIFCKETMDEVIKKLWTMWSYQSIQATMMKSMLSDLITNYGNGDFECTTEHLMNGVKAKNYVPLMKRKKCESLESKIEHFVKRRRIEVVATESESEKKEEPQTLTQNSKNIEENGEAKEKRK